VMIVISPHRLADLIAVDNQSCLSLMRTDVRAAEHHREASPCDRCTAIAHWFSRSRPVITASHTNISRQQMPESSSRQHKSSIFRDFSEFRVWFKCNTCPWRAIRNASLAYHFTTCRKINVVKPLPKYAHSSICCNFEPDSTVTKVNAVQFESNLLLIEETMTESKRDESKADKTNRHSLSQSLRHTLSFCDTTLWESR
jgi:hypothetical protein